MGKRVTTQQTIIEAAASVLLEKGLAKTSMEIVSEAANIHRRTIYRYFPLREDLFFEVAIFLLEEMNDYQRSLKESISGSGIEKFSTFLFDLTDYLDKRRPMLRFMGEFDFYFNEKRKYSPSKDLAARFFNASKVYEDILSELVHNGIEDGSIVLPKRPEVFIPTLSTVLWGTAQRAALRGKMIKDEFGVSGTEMIRCQIELYIDAISAERKA
ncbi:MAG: TetR/AcrR family transcriptional regulator [Spirochaetales bacterium]|nr:TetR/AcrR family transcriptional regulator [Spirochaetales bacterium]